MEEASRTLSRVPILEAVFSGDFHVHAVTSDIGSAEITSMKGQGLRGSTALCLLVVSLATVVPAALIRQTCVVGRLVSALAILFSALFLPGKTKVPLSFRLF